MSMSRDTWEGTILGAVLGSIIIPIVYKCVSLVSKWWRQSRPAHRLLQGAARQSEPCKIFIRDLTIQPGTKIYSVQPRLGIGEVPNVLKFWAEVDSKAVADVFNVLGQAGKTRNLDIVLVSQDYVGEWDCHVVVVGAQAGKSDDFYQKMKDVAYRMDDANIVDMSTNKSIPRDKQHGYGIILKARNPFKTHGSPGIAFLIGGFGTLGTEAASYYFRQNFRKLGKEFGSKSFGIVLRASCTAGVQAAERVAKWDRRF